MLLLCGFFLRLPCFGQSQEVDSLLEQATKAQSSGNYASAAKLYARATDLLPSEAELWSNRGVMEFLAGQLDTSIVSLKHALLLNPHLFTPRLFLGKAYMQSSKPALALPYLNRAHALHPDDIETLLTLGKTNMDLKQPAEAAADYEEASRSAPQNAAPWFGLGVATLAVIEADGQQLAASQAQSIWAQALYADELFAQGKPLEATEKYKVAFGHATSVQKSDLARILAWMQSHPDLFPVPANSKEALSKLIADIEPESDTSQSEPCAPNYRSDATNAQSKTAGTRPVLSAAALMQDAGCAFRGGDYERSALDANDALRKAAGSPQALYWSVKANERIAVAALARFEELSPQSPANYVLVGNLYRFQRQSESALAEYKKALALDPRDSSALMGSALASLAVNKLDDAAGFAQEALNDRPSDPQLNLLMAEILDAENKRNEIEPYLAKCTDAPAELQPRVHYLRGRVYAEQGRTSDAIHQYELALPGDKDGTIHYQLSRLYRKTGNVAEAEKTLTDAKALIGKRDANASIVVREAEAANR